MKTIVTILVDVWESGYVSATVLQPLSGFGSTLTPKATGTRRYRVQVPVEDIHAIDAEGASTTQEEP